MLWSGRVEKNGTIVIDGGKSESGAVNGADFPAMIYANPLNHAKYVVLNTRLTIVDRDYNGDYGLSRWGDYAIV